MPSILLLGAGQIGEAITAMLAKHDEYQVTVADVDRAALNRLPNGPTISLRPGDVGDRQFLQAAAAGKDAVVCALPYTLNGAVSHLCAELGLAYFDLTEDVASTQALQALSANARAPLVAQCGLAPGYIAILAHDLVTQFDRIDRLELRVGALPRFPTNALKYNLTWSVDGLINEYCNPCEAVVDGTLMAVPPLAELESFSIDGVAYEAFNTSGGLGTLAQTLAGRVRMLNYKTVRYPGHRDHIHFLLNDLGLRHDRALARRVVANGVPATDQDMVLIFVNAVGEKAGRLVQKSHAQRIVGRAVGDRALTAIQTTTAAALCATLDLVLTGTLAAQGFVRQEDIRLAQFMANRFAAPFAHAT